MIHQKLVVCEKCNIALSFFDLTLHCRQHLHPFSKQERIHWLYLVHPKQKIYILYLQQEMHEYQEFQNLTTELLVVDIALVVVSKDHLVRLLLL